MHDSYKALPKLGYRPTPQRLMVLAALTKAEEHLTAEQIHGEVQARYPHVSISTIYRNLALLTRLGLVAQAELGQGRVQYHLAEKGHHHHLVCSDCGATLEIGEELFFPMKEALLHQHGFYAHFSHFAIFGHCCKCRKKADGS